MFTVAVYNRYHDGFQEEILKTELEKAKELWEQFGDIPIDDNDCIVEPFKQFPIGTDRFEIWHWFEREFNVSVAKDLMEVEE